MTVVEWEKARKSRSQQQEEQDGGKHQDEMERWTFGTVRTHLESSGYRRSGRARSAQVVE